MHSDKLFGNKLAEFDIDGWHYIIRDQLEGQQFFIDRYSHYDGEWHGYWVVDVKDNELRWLNSLEYLPRGLKETAETLMHRILQIRLFL
jgi:hypothetical protein